MRLKRGETASSFYEVYCGVNKVRRESDLEELTPLEIFNKNFKDLASNIEEDWSCGAVDPSMDIEFIDGSACRIKNPREECSDSHIEVAEHYEMMSGDEMSSLPFEEIVRERYRSRLLLMISNNLGLPITRITWDSRNATVGDVIK